MTQPQPQFAVVTDGGTDIFPQLHHDIPLAPFWLNIGSDTHRVNEYDAHDLIALMKAGSVQTTTSQPTPQDWARAIGEAGAGGLPVLALTISRGLSGSIVSLEQALALVPDIPVTIHDSRTVMGGQALQVHVAVEASRRGETLPTALEWLRQTYEESETYITIETLEYLRRGGRIGRVAATLGGLLNLKPVIIVDKKEAIYHNLARVRSYKGAIAAIGEQITKRFGEGTPLRVALVHGAVPEDADYLLEQLKTRHPIVWSDKTLVNPVLLSHVGPRSLGLGVAAHHWVWER